MPPRPSLGLRARLLFAFALLCVVTAAAVAGGIYVVARNAILQRAQDAAVQTMTSRLESVFPLRNPAPGPAELGQIADTVTDRNSVAVAVYHGAHSLAVRQRVLRDDVNVAPVELRIARLVLRRDEALAENHVGGAETARIRAAEENRVAGHFGINALLALRRLQQLFAFFSPARTSFCNRSWRFWSDARSASTSSVLMTSMSRIGSIVALTW